MPTFSLDPTIEAQLSKDMKKRLQSSLQSTEQARGAKKARLRSSADVKQAPETTSPGLHPAAAPPVTSPESPILQAVELSSAAIETNNSTCELDPTEVFGADGSSTLPAEGCQASASSTAPPVPLPSFEFEGMLDHELLLESLYASQGIDLRAQQNKAAQLLAEVGLRSLDLGVKNVDEAGKELINQCFYLSIARSYLGPSVDASEVQKTALFLKRTVESCVLAAHPEWAYDEQRLGENAMAFADFLPVAMAAKDPPNLVAQLAVLILDSTQGHAEVYIGPLYAGQTTETPRAREELEKNLVLLCYTPGHYKALVLDDVDGSKPAWTYPELKSLLDERGVLCIETCDFD